MMEAKTSLCGVLGTCELTANVSFCCLLMWKMFYPPGVVVIFFFPIPNNVKINKWSRVWPNTAAEMTWSALWTSWYTDWHRLTQLDPSQDCNLCSCVCELIKQMYITKTCFHLGWQSTKEVASDSAHGAVLQHKMKCTVQRDVRIWPLNDVRHIISMFLLSDGASDISFAHIGHGKRQSRD